MSVRPGPLIIEVPSDFPRAHRCITRQCSPLSGQCRPLVRRCEAARASHILVMCWHHDRPNLQDVFVKLSVLPSAQLHGQMAVTWLHWTQCICGYSVSTPHYALAART